MSNSVKQILLLRHGMTDWNSQSRYQGRIDVPLNARGRLQARSCRPVLDRWQPQEVWASSLSRAIDTACLATGWERERLRMTDDLCEIAFGRWESQERDEIARRWTDEYARWGDDPETATPPGGEPFVNVRRRTARVLAEVTASEVDRCLIVSHGGTLRALLAEAMGAPSRAVWRFCLGNCSLTGLELWNGACWLSFANDCRHLTGSALCPTEMDGLGTWVPTGEAAVDPFERS